ncbi:hypothetical protein LZ30DRAFT_339492 [Colletotrichum cereale]|nr:hypothetical protein LZ30DRAFT_339492 [Colletotrichum cereale]
MRRRGYDVLQANVAGSRPASPQRHGPATPASPHQRVCHVNGQGRPPVAPLRQSLGFGPYASRGRRDRPDLVLRFPPKP